MTRYSKFNVIYRLQKWLDSVPGQTFMNYAYSWGASIVILGTLFKLTHLPGANFMLFLGMGTEVVVFFIAAFDRPFDKTADGMELPTHVGDEDLSQVVVNGDNAFAPAGGGTTVIGGGDTVIGGGGTTVIGGGGGGGTVIIGGGGAIGHEAPSEAVGGTTSVDTEAIAAVASSVTTMAGGTVVSPVPQVNPELEEATANYVDELKRLTEMLSKVAEQSERLTRDSEEMENLNRTLTGICKIYEMQLKGASQQIGTIDQINEQTRKMADQIAELNQIYTRMIEAMTVNMPKGPVAP
ncbi:MAG: gliding motility protein GldL [Prevotella sp.]|nr:gliding motility protein GldL [Prevotella sp.]